MNVKLILALIDFVEEVIDQIASCLCFLLDINTKKLINIRIFLILYSILTCNFFSVFFL